MLKRKIYDDLLKWKEKKNKMPLIIKGARQVGKTYIIDKFCRENYDNYVYINFFEDSEYFKIYDYGLSADEIIRQITVRVPNINLVPHKTIIFFDEIQDCPNAIAALKFLAIDGKYDIIATGSLLGINYKEVPSYPVGYVEHMNMFSLDFEEFCWADGMNEKAIGYLKEYFDEMKPLPDDVHKRMMKIFKEYIIVGGMPRVVDEFINSNNFSNVYNIQKNIIEDYKLDIGKYAKETEKAKIRDCFLSIPKHLSKDYKKFRYSLVSSGGRAEKYQGSLRWLKDANLINICYNLSFPESPLEEYVKEGAFKVYLADTGLLMSMLERGVQKEIMDGNLGIYKGAIYENIVAEMFAKQERKLYYFEYNSTLEVDFIIRYNNEVTGVEVKAADNTKSKSLKSLMTKWNVKKGIRLSSKNLGFKDNILYIPLYMTMFLKEDEVTETL